LGGFPLFPFFPFFPLFPPFSRVLITIGLHENTFKKPEKREKGEKGKRGKGENLFLFFIVFFI
jgi:hypothetical protein